VTPSPPAQPHAQPPEDRVLLEGPHSRRRELLLLLRALRDFLAGFRALHFVGPCVTVFGSARIGEPHPYYEMAREIGRGLGRVGFTVMTGGGPGLMEAANRGARDVGARSVGCNIVLPVEQKPNPYVDRSVDSHHFFVRKVLLFKYSYAFIALPGGIGTADEFFEALTLVQTKKIENFPIVLMGREYWAGLLTQLHDMMTAGAIDADDLKLVLVTDDVGEALAYVEHHAISRFGLKRRRIKSSRWLGEPRDDRTPAAR